MRRWTSTSGWNSGVWMRANVALLFMVVIFSQPLYAEESDPPSLELLEFLGSRDGEMIEWADPSVVASMTADDAEREDGRGDKQEDE